MDVSDWLRTHGFARYEAAFAANAIDSNVLPALTENDLKKLGVPLRDRKRLIRAIRATLADPWEARLPNEGAGRSRSEQSRVRGLERRHLTVMICDLAASTALSARLDPEDMRAVTDAYHAACGRIVASYDGFLAEFRGDGILACFGYPHAHEDDAERAVRAGLDIVATVAQLATPAQEPLAVRVGIATGLVVIGDRSRKGALPELAVVGETPNIADRVQGLVEVGTVVVAGSTRELLGNVFQLRYLGQHEFKGIAEPVSVWAVEGVPAPESHLKEEMWPRSEQRPEEKEDDEKPRLPQSREARIRVVRDQLAEAASPAPSIASDGRLDAGPNQLYDAPTDSSDLPALPIRQCRLIKTILSDLPRNAPRHLKTALEIYDEELRARGVQPILGLLKDMAVIIESVVAARDAAEWLHEGMLTAFDRLASNHGLFVKHFPLDPKREALYASTHRTQSDDAVSGGRPGNLRCEQGRNRD
jgi:class 3 adenylate cyclase